MVQKMEIKSGAVQPTSTCAVDTGLLFRFQEAPESNYNDTFENGKEIVRKLTGLKWLRIGSIRKFRYQDVEY
jgi:hypothetical protein